MVGITTLLASTNCGYLSMQTIRSSVEVAAAVEAVLNRCAEQGWYLDVDMTHTADMLVLKRKLSKDSI